MAIEISRRQAMIGATGLALAIVGRGTVAHAAKNDHEELIKAFTGGKTPTKGRVKLDLPEIAENGNTVPLGVSVTSPMTASDYCKDVLVVSEGNPRGGLCAFHFTPASGVVEVSTRVRLAETQNVIAIAKMSDGSLFMDTRQVKVTIGGCGG